MFGCHGIGHRWCILGLVFYPWNTKDIILTHRVEASLSLPGSFAVKGLGHQFGQVLRGASGHFLVVHWCLCEAIQLEGGATGLPKELLLGTKTWWLGDALQSQIGSKCIGTLSQGRVTETGVTWCNYVHICLMMSLYPLHIFTRFAGWCESWTAWTSVEVLRWGIPGVMDLEGPKDPVVGRWWQLNLHEVWALYHPLPQHPHWPGHIRARGLWFWSENQNPKLCIWKFQPEADMTSVRSMAVQRSLKEFADD